MWMCKMAQAIMRLNGDLVLFNGLQLQNAIKQNALVLSCQQDGPAAAKR